MSVATLQSTGFGTLAYRLVIEGWPEMFVTDPRITASSYTDGRTVITGLQRQGLQIHDRIIPQEAKITASGNTFRIVPPQGIFPNDPCTASLSVYPDPVGALGDSVTASGTTFSLKGGGSLTNGEEYHIGTETFRVGTWPTVTRTVWDTLSQSHNTSLYDETKTVYIYARPPTMEGRRCYLYAYGKTDTVTGPGTLWWRGIVSRAPKLDRDNITWIIEALPITHVLKQNVAGGNVETHPVGIYHNNDCTFGFYLETMDIRQRVIYRYPEVDDPGGEAIDTEQTLIDEINTKLATALTETGIDAYIDSITLVKDPGAAGKFAFQIVTGSTPTWGIRVVGGSPLIGWTDTYWDGLYYRDNTSPDEQISIDRDDTLGMFAFTGLVKGDTTYYAPLTYNPAGYQFPGSEWNYDDSKAATAIGPIYGVFLNPPQGPHMTDHNYPGPLFRSATNGSSVAHPYRIHVDRALTGAEAVFIEGTFKETGTFAIEDIGVTSKAIGGATADFNWVELVRENTVSQTVFGDPQRNFREISRSRGNWGIISAGTTVRAIRSYGHAVSVTGFVAALKTQAVSANDGDTPFITDEDLTEWELTGEALPSVVLLRSYHFTRSKTVETILAEECKLAGHLMRIESDGRVGIIPLPIVTEVENVDTAHTISGADIITPAGTFGAWPEVEPQRDGLVTMIEVQDEYSASQDAHLDQPKVFQDADAIAAHKTRGKSPLKIAPYSHRSVPADPTYAPRLASKLLAFFARDYNVITVKVPYTKFDVLCGDTVSLTHRLIPDGSGSRGITGRRGICIERRWNLDGRSEEHGTLTIWLAAKPIAGYAPGGIITSQSDGGGNLWTLTLSVANALNIELSVNNDGQVLDHFANGYAIRIVQGNAAVPNVETGTVTAVNAVAGTITVQLDSSWTPAAMNFLEFGTHDVCTTAQRKYAFVADANLKLSDDNFARVLS